MTAVISVSCLKSCYNVRQMISIIISGIYMVWAQRWNSCEDICAQLLGHQTTGLHWRWWSYIFRQGHQPPVGTATFPPGLLGSVDLHGGCMMEGGREGWWTGCPETFMHLHIAGNAVVLTLPLETSQNGLQNKLESQRSPLSVINNCSV